ncbi:hypothetical protein K505DRAFT_398261 [Melanomma pulvis-pyrius CBS 109.77]|uniref:Uncharacterized protein n=1 Tax=Melanomma pulvis-pyrius CBS 109.77 TaxID=1314802 RepID=A0A6A6XLW9_9PLEO|nr:hypothetical protein K505DRAFT_398261 [Melanomma pulvis-pyrius CBS 109.77]
MASSCASSGPHARDPDVAPVMAPQSARRDSQVSSALSPYQLMQYHGGRENSLKRAMTVHASQHGRCAQWWWVCSARVAACSHASGSEDHGIDAESRDCDSAEYREVPGATEQEALFPHPSASLGLPSLATCRPSAVAFEWLAQFGFLRRDNKKAVPSVATSPPQCSWSGECIGSSMI